MAPSVPFGDLRRLRRQALLHNVVAGQIWILGQHAAFPLYRSGYPIKLRAGKVFNNQNENEESSPVIIARPKAAMTTPAPI